MMKIYGVIVTYSNRFKILERVIKSCFNAGINKLIIVDNNSEMTSKLKLEELEKNLNYKLKVVYLDENIGSAGGFKRGLQEAYKNNDCEYILTLDDDNVIAKDSLNKLQNILNYLDKYKDNIMLAMYRPMWEWDRKAIEKGWVKSYRPNNFMGFNFLAFLKQFLTKKILKNKKNNFFPLQPAEISAMGGLFFRKSIINKIGYPNEDFFVYADDHEYTYRFTKNGGKIFLCSEVVIEDIDQTSLNDNNESINFFHKDFSELKMYYAIRNHTYLSKSFITNKIFFYGNIGIVSLLYFRNILHIPFSLFIKRYKLYLRAMTDGLKDKLGRTY